MKTITNLQEKRKAIEILVYNVFNTLDTTNENTNFYKKLFKSMSDVEFFKFMKKIANRDKYFYLDIETFNREPTIQNIEDAAGILNIPLFEHVVFFDKETNQYITTTTEVPVGYIHTRRVQQLVVKKNNTTTNINVRNPKNGQVTAHSKTVRDSDMENYVMTILEADNIMKEFLGPRADDMVMKQEMYRNIIRDGYCSLDDLSSDVSNKTSLNTLDSYFLSAGIKTDLVTDTLLLRRTSDRGNTNLTTNRTKHNIQN